MGLSSDQKDKRRAEILAAATEVFLEKGFDGASLNEIASRAHASKETLYAWFGTKAQILSMLIEEGMHEIGARIAREFAQGTPDDVLFVMAREILRMINLSPLVRLFNAAAAGARSSPELREMITKRALDHGGIARYLEACRAQGLMKFDDAAQMASIFVAMAQAEYPTKLGLGAIAKISDEEIDAHSRLVAQMFRKAVAP